MCQASWLGLVPYEEAWRLQEKLAREIGIGEEPACLLLLEHPHSFTSGRSTKPGHLLWDESELIQKNVLVYEVDRGGDITYHGPGQLVGYPLFRLAKTVTDGNRIPSADYVGFLRKIEEALILTLSKFGIEGIQRPGFTGVWVAEGSSIGGKNSTKDIGVYSNKIASIGVKVDVNGVSRHGFSLNVNPDMEYWNGIIPCGLDGVSMTSMAENIGKVPEMERVVEEIIRSFEKVFDLEISVTNNLFTAG